MGTFVTPPVPPVLVGQGRSECGQRSRASGLGLQGRRRSGLSRQEPVEDLFGVSPAPAPLPEEVPEPVAQKDGHADLVWYP